MKILTLSFLFISFSLFGQVSGSVDSSFNIRKYHKEWSSAEIFKVIRQNDKLIIGGYMHLDNGTSFQLCRLNPDNTLDESFNSAQHFNGEIRDIILQDDDKIIVVGTFSSYNGATNSGVVRLMPDGSVDPTFFMTPPSAGGAGGTIFCVELQNDGKVIIGGNLDTYNNYNRKNIFRLDQNGLIDTSFNCHIDTFYSITNGCAFTDFQVLPNNDIVASFYGTIRDGYSIPGQFIGKEYKGIIKFNEDGTLNQQFNDYPLTNTEWHKSIELQGDKIIGGGFIHTLTRLDFDGYADPSFSPPNGFTNDLDIVDIEILEDSSLLIAYNDGLDGMIMRLNKNGGLITYNGLPIGTYQSGFTDEKNNTVATFSQGFVCGGEFESDPDAFLMANGIAFYDTSLNQYNEAYGVGSRHSGVSTYALKVEDVDIYPNDDILISGPIKTYNNIDVNGIARIDKNGYFNSSFQTGTGVFEPGSSGVIKSTVICPDESILAGGDFEFYDGVQANNLIKLNDDGSYNPSFFADYTADGIEKIELTENGDVFVIGDITQLSTNTSRNNLFKLSLSGQLDTNFHLPDYPVISDGYLKDFDIQSDSTLIICGNFKHNEYPLPSVRGLSRIGFDGHRDTTFNIGTGFYYQGSQNNFSINKVKVLPNNSILVIGHFDEYNGYSRNGIIRLYPNGELDTTFNVGTGISTFWSMRSDILVQPDGKYLIVGNFSTYNGNPVNGRMRLNPDGSVDTTFNSTSIQSNGKVIKLQSDGSIVISTSSESYSSLTEEYQSDLTGVVRLKNENFTPPLNLSVNNITDSDCSNNGTSEILGYGGVPPYQFSWNGTPFSTSSNISFNAPGFHDAAIIDSILNTNDLSVYLEGPTSGLSHDLVGNIITTQFRPGHDTPIFIDVYNKTCIPTDGTISLILPNLVHFNTSNPPPNIIQGDTLIWNFTSLSFDPNHLHIWMDVTSDTSYAIGDSVFIDLLVEPLLGDLDTSNNTRNYEFPILNGYDPNDKKVYPTGECIPNYVDTNEVLTYTVRFQNTGNSSAINIYILDTIDVDLDLNTFEVLATSHSMITENLGYNVLKFKFDNINLSDSTSNQAESHGYVVFQIQPKQGLSFGQKITNSSSIYFDYNPPIYTNSVLNTISDGSHVNSASSLSLSDCDSIQYGGVWLSASGQYVFESSNSFGCDSTHTLSLTLNTSSDTTLTVSAVGQYTLNGSTYASSGTYFQLLNNNVGCDSIITLDLTLDYLGNSELNSANVSIYPNPIEDRLTINGLSEELAKIEFYDVFGRLILKLEDYESNHVIDTSNLAPGTYYVIINNDSIIRLLKQ